MATTRIALLGIFLPLVGCALFQRPAAERVDMPPLHVRADTELMTLNDEELLAAGSSAYAAGDLPQAVRCFERLADAFPNSRHHRVAVYNAGLAHGRLKAWAEAAERFRQIADPKAEGDGLDAAFRLAEALYQLEQYDEAATLLATIAARAELPMDRRMEAMVQRGICELEAGRVDGAEKLLREVIATYDRLPEKDEVEGYHPSQAQFFLGEIYRFHYEAVTLDPEKGLDALAQDLELKAELLLSAQGHYLRTVRMGHGYWATAAGSQIGALYENLYQHLLHSPAPKELDAEQAELYRQELRKKVRVLVTKAINIYERTLETAERIGTSGPFIERARESLQKMKDLLVADLKAEEEEADKPPELVKPPPSRSTPRGAPPPKQRARPARGKNPT